MKNKPGKRRKFWKRFLIVSGVLVLLGLTAAHFIGKRLGYAGAWDFITSYGNHTSRGMSASYETLDIKISKDDYKKLKNIRDQSVKAGMQQDVTDPWVKGKIKHRGQEIKIKLRLKGHMTDHLEGKKWSFRIKTRKGDAYNGMQIFSIQHPGTRGYAYEWIFHEILKREGIVALRYDFVNVNLNGDNLGIYAVEENFAEELTENNKRPKGPILRFNPDMYWIFRYDELKGDKFHHENASWQASKVEPYDDNDVLNDSSSMRLYTKGMRLLEGFKNGDYKTSEIFDVEKLAIYHAWIDVIGGQHSLDWTDVKYYYNSVTSLLEPVAYESFSAFPVYELNGSFRFGAGADSRTDLHNLMFSDTVFFAEYIRQLTRMSSEAWIKSSLKAIDKHLQKKLDILYSEWPYRDFKTDIYVSNAAVIRKMLSMPQQVHAFVEKKENDTLYLRIAGIDGLPVWLRGIGIDGKNINVSSNKKIIPPKERNKSPQYLTYAVHVGDSVLSKISLKSKITLQTFIPGMVKWVETEVKGQYWNEYTGDDVNQKMTLAELREFPFLTISERDKRIDFRPGKHSISTSIFFPTGYTIYIGNGSRIDLTNKARLVVNGSLHLEGNSDIPVEIISSDRTGSGITVLGNGNGTVLINYASISGMGNRYAAVMLYECKVNIRHSKFFDIGSAGLHISRGEGKLKEVVISNCGKHGLQAEFTNLVADEIVVDHCSSSGFKLTGTDITFSKSKISTCTTGIHAELYADVKGINNSIKDCTAGIKTENGPKIRLRNITLNNLSVAVMARHDKDNYGISEITLMNTTFKNVKTQKKINGACKITISK